MSRSIPRRILPDVYKRQSLDRNVISLNSIVSDDTDSELIDFVPGGDTADPVYEETNQKMLCETINEVLAKLDARESYIVKRCV